MCALAVAMVLFAHSNQAAKKGDAVRFPQVHSCVHSRGSSVRTTQLVPEHPKGCGMVAGVRGQAAKKGAAARFLVVRAHVHVEGSSV